MNYFLLLDSPKWWDPLLWSGRWERRFAFYGTCCLPMLENTWHPSTWTKMIWLCYTRQPIGLGGSSFFWKKSSIRHRGRWIRPNWQSLREVNLSVGRPKDGVRELMLQHCFCSTDITKTPSWESFASFQALTKLTTIYWQASHTGDAAKVKGERKRMHIKRRERARAGVTFCQHARPVNRCQKMIKSQEKKTWKPCKKQCFSSLAFTKPCKYQ